MSEEDGDEDEPWPDDQGDLDNDAASCPECGRPVHSIADKCPACGYWLTGADRHSMWFGESKPLWLRVTAVIVLAAFLISLLAISGAIF
jgi:hypothetical protein